MEKLTKVLYEKGTDGEGCIIFLTEDNIPLKSVYDDDKPSRIAIGTNEEAADTVKEYAKHHTEVRCDEDNLTLDNWPYVEVVHGDGTTFNGDEGVDIHCTCEGACGCNKCVETGFNPSADDTPRYPEQCTETNTTFCIYPDTRYSQYKYMGNHALLLRLEALPWFHAMPNEPTNNSIYEPCLPGREFRQIDQRTECGRVLCSPAEEEPFENQVEREDLFDHRGIHQLALLEAPPQYEHEVVRVDEVTEILLLQYFGLVFNCIGK